MKNSQKGFALLTVLLIAVGVLIAGGAGYWYYQSQNKTPELIGGQKDAHGCLGPAGYSWCEVKQKCLRVWEEKCEATSTVQTSNSLPTLTQEQAQALVSQTWGGCTPDTCGSVAVTVQNSNGQYTVTALYEGLRDDSTSAQKKVALVYYSNNVWSLGEAIVTQRCQLQRGHQDFSPDPCF